MAKKRRKKTSKRRTKRTTKRRVRRVVKKTYHRKNPKRVRAGRIAAAIRWGKKYLRKKTVKRRKRRATRAVMFGPIYEPKRAGKGGIYQKRLAALAKARAARKAYARYREAGILG